MARPAWVHDAARISLLSVLLLLGPMVAADEYADSWGPEIGSALPLLAAPDQTGALRNLDNLAGERGLLLFLVRSADW